ncbi:cobalamin-binding protein, partial [Candidatus Bathyarchaeota archaeon]|nr:cobalamin-binding protein [Candidatus Bathyarchaeota archaeon]
MKNVIMIGLLILIVTVGMVNVTDALPSITVVDDLGRVVAITSSERIVSIGPSCTEILYALGLSDRVIAVDKYSDYPPEAVAKQRISKACMPDPEEVAALNPDLVVYYHWGPWDPTVETLSDLGLTIIALAPKTLDDILRDIRVIGSATSKSQEAEVLASALSRRISGIRDKTSIVTMRPKVYIEYWYPPPWTFGPNTWVHQLIELAGGTNSFGDAAVEWVQTTDEEVITRNPDVIISLCGTMHYASLEDVKRRPGWDRISAVVNGAVYLVDENLFVRPGPRIVDGLETLARILHPELFGEANVFTFLVNATVLRLSTQTFSVSGLMTVDILTIKAAANCILTATLLKVGPEVPASKKLVGIFLDVDCSIPMGLAVTLRIHYTEDQLKTLDVSESSLKIYTWDEEEAKWMALNSAVNEGENYVEATVTRLGYFALMGEPTPSLWEHPIPFWLFIT